MNSFSTSLKTNDKPCAMCMWAFMSLLVLYELGLQDILGVPSGGAQNLEYITGVF